MVAGVTQGARYRTADNDNARVLVHISCADLDRSESLARYNRLIVEKTDALMSVYNGHVFLSAEEVKKSTLTC